jgi:hypothetical protein
MTTTAGRQQQWGMPAKADRNMRNIQNNNTRGANFSGVACNTIAGQQATSETRGPSGRETKVGLNVVFTFNGFSRDFSFLPNLY